MVQRYPTSNKHTWKWAVAALFAGSALAPGFAQEDPELFAPADMVLTGGKVITVDKDFSIAEAVAVKGGKILAVGKAEDIGKLADGSTKKVDLKGKTLLPGINDNHMHFHWIATGHPTPVLKMGKDVNNTKAQDKAYILTAMKKMNALGITSMTEPGLTEEYISAFRELQKEGKMTVRVNTMYAFSQRTENTFSKFQAGMKAAGPYKPSDNDWLNVIGLKIGADSLPNDKSAWMMEDYKTGGNGKLTFPGSTHEERIKAMSEMMAKTHELGYQVNVHATGDRSIKTAVEILAKLETDQPKNLRHMIHHGEYSCLDPEVLKLMAKHNIGVAMQPGLSMMVGHSQESNMKPAVFARFAPTKSLISAGVHVSGGSDGPFVDPDWRVGVQSAITRKAGRGSGMFKGPFPTKQLGPDQTIALKDALRLYTIESAWQERKDHVKGSIEVGKLADFCVLEGDLLTLDTGKIQDAQVVMTIVDGKIVHGGQYDGD